jgi:4-hydroxybutyrate CoA-transferase
MDWKEEYKRKLVSAEEAVKVVKPGDTVVISNRWEPELLEQSLAARKDELTNVNIHTDLREGRIWLQPELQNSFKIYVWLPFSHKGEGLESKVGEWLPASVGLSRFKAEDERAGKGSEIDVFMVVLSKPDKNGFCSFGQSLADKKVSAMKAKTVLAEVNDLPQTRFRTYGDNFIHVSQIDYFVEHVPSLAARSLSSRPRKQFGEVEKRICQHVAGLIKDGDTIEVGVGQAIDGLGILGAFNDKRDLGCHSGRGLPGIVNLVREGIFTGERKTIHRGKAVMGALMADEEELAFVDGNPMFEMYSLKYIQDLRVLAAQDNFVAINSALAVDLLGQITGESVGHGFVGTPGGLPPFVIGAMASKGGRSIIALPSTASAGKISRIIPRFEAGVPVTIPHYLSDYIVTEYGVAELLGKTQKERVDQLIAIACPEYREELRKQANKLHLY